MPRPGRPLFFAPWKTPPIDTRAEGQRRGSQSVETAASNAARSTAGSDAAARGNPSSVWRFGQDRRFDMIRQAVTLDGADALDLGCGLGMYTQRMADHGARPIGLEIEWPRAVEARQSGLRIIAAVGEFLPLADRSLDVILLHEVLEHVADDRATFVELARVLRSGGRAIIFVPNRLWPFETHGMMWRGAYRFGNIPLINWLPDPLRNRLAPHVRVYTSSRLRSRLDGLPLQIALHTQIFPGFDGLAARRPRLAGALRTMPLCAGKNPAPAVRAFSPTRRGAPSPPNVVESLPARMAAQKASFERLSVERLSLRSPHSGARSVDRPRGASYAGQAPYPPRSRPAAPLHVHPASSSAAVLGGRTVGGNSDVRRRYLNAFAHVGGIGPYRLVRLERHFGSLQLAWGAPEASLRRVIGPKSAEAVALARPGIDIEAAWETIGTCGARMITPDDAGWPSGLRNIPTAPLALYLRGDIGALTEPTIAIVGTRRCSDYGRRSAWTIAEGLARAGLGIVSGMALGIDTVAHRAALSVGGRTVAVLGCGVDVCYPTGNTRLRDEIVSRGAVISELAPGAPALAKHFPARNRIVSGLTLATVVVEAGFKSGALITARYAADQGRDVFAVPGRIDDTQARGSNELIATGAGLVTSAEDVLSFIDNELRDAELRDAERGAREELAVAPSEAALLSMLDEEPRHIDALVIASELPPSEVAQSLALLELKGLARNVGAMRWIEGDAEPVTTKLEGSIQPDTPKVNDDG